MQQIQVNEFTITISKSVTLEYYIASVDIPLKDSGYPVYFNGGGETRLRAVYSLHSVLSAVSLTARRLNPADDDAANRIHELCLGLLDLEVADLDTPEPSPAKQDKTAHTIG